MSGPEWVAEPSEIAGQVVAQFPGRSDAWLLRANAALATVPPDREGAIESFIRAAELDPWSSGLAARLAELEWSAGNRGQAAIWARKALENDDWLRLDPVVRMDAATRARMEALAGRVGEGGPAGANP